MLSFRGKVFGNRYSVPGTDYHLLITDYHLLLEREQGNFTMKCHPPSETPVEELFVEA